METEKEKLTVEYFRQFEEFGFASEEPAFCWLTGCDIEIQGMERGGFLLLSVGKYDFTAKSYEEALILCRMRWQNFHPDEEFPTKKEDHR